MEQVILEESPLAAYLEGRGEAEPENDTKFAQSSVDSERAPSFAPRTHPSKAPKHKKSQVAQAPSNGILSKLRSAYALAVTSTLGSADNERFLEHFRYIIIASQLLNEHVGANSQTSLRSGDLENQTPPDLSNTATLTGAAISAFAAFSVAWMLNWARLNRPYGFNKGRILVFVCFVALVGVVVYAYARRHWLKYLRHRAIDSCTEFVENLHTYEASSSSVLSLIQELELVSRGYQLSNPLPPISRIEGAGESRRGLLLRKSLQECHAITIPAFRDAFEQLRIFYNQDDLERFLEVYDVRTEDCQEALIERTDDSEGEVESLKHLRSLQHIHGTLRRLVLCALLSIPATGRRVDMVRWRSAVDEMHRLVNRLREGTQKIEKILNDEEQPTIVSPRKRSSLSTNAPASPTSSSHVRLQSQIRRISNLTTNTRTLQAKLHLLREDSVRASSSSTPDLVRLRDDYDALGSDIRQLLTSWESGRAALADDIRAARLSRTSSEGSVPLRSPVHSLGGLTVVNEDGIPAALQGSPTTALRALNGEPILVPERPLSPPTTDDDTGAEDDEEVFEAVVPAATAGPKSTLSREERIVVMREERAKAAQMNDRREARSNMMRELQTVINLRPSRQRRATDGGERGVSL